MQLIIWGSGIWGKRMYECVWTKKEHEIVAFIDSLETKWGTTMFSLPIISYEQYKQRYKDMLIIVCICSKQARQVIEEQLMVDGISYYFMHIDCPSEMIFPRLNGVPFSEMIMESGIDSESIAIYGNNLFSVLLYDFLSKRGNNVCLLYEEKQSNYEYLSQHGYLCFHKNELPEVYSLILHTETGWNDAGINIFKEVKNIQFRDFSFLMRYRNNMIADFKDKYSNEKRCFIVASGPSLKIEDLDKLYEYNEICFTMNRVYLAFEKSKWRPQFYVVTDGKCLVDNSYDLINLEVPYKFFSDASEEFWQNNKRIINSRTDIYKYHITGNFYEEYEPQFSTDLTKGTYLGLTVVYDCIQFAIYMGFKSIYLIGVDFEFKQTGNADDDHFIKGYAKTAKQEYFYDGLEWQGLAYKKARQYADLHGIKIYNATRGGALEVFERVNFDSLFET